MFEKPVEIEAFRLIYSQSGSSGEAEHDAEGVRRSGNKSIICLNGVSPEFSYTVFQLSKVAIVASRTKKNVND